jgi:hypothetical protein
VKRLQPDGEGALTLPAGAEWQRMHLLILFSGFTDFHGNGGDCGGVMVGGIKHFTALALRGYGTSRTIRRDAPVRAGANRRLAMALAAALFTLL